MSTPRRSLSRRLILVSMVWIALSLSVGGIALSFIFQQSVREAFQDSLTAQLRAVIACLDVEAPGCLTSAGPLDDARYDRVQSGWYWQISAADGFLIRSRSLWDETLTVADAEAGKVTFSDIAGPRGQKLWAAATAVHIQDLPPRIVVAAMDTTPINAQVQRFNRVIFLALGVLGVGLIVAVILQVFIGLRPLRRLTRELKAIRDGAQDRLPDGHPSEITPLVDAFNEVRAHDAETVARTRREVGNLAHSLKTPLAQMNANLDTLPGKARADLTIHINDLRAKIDFYAARAATAAARGATARRVVIHDVAQDIVAALTKIHADAGKAASVDIPRSLTVMAEEEDVTEVLGNLLDNAFKWARKRIVIKATESDTHLVVITVDDDGPGVASEMVEQIQRGRRLDETVPGTGLGLQIVRDIVQAYGGTLTLGESVMGGLRATVHLPAKTAGALERKP